MLVNLRLTDQSGDREADAVVVWPGVGVAVVEVIPEGGGPVKAGLCLS